MPAGRRNRPHRTDDADALLSRREPGPGRGVGLPVTTDYGQRKFTGTVNWVEIDVGKDDHDHLISPEERLNLAMAFQ